MEKTENETKSIETSTHKIKINKFFELTINMPVEMDLETFEAFLLMSKRMTSVQIRTKEPYKENSSQDSVIRLRQKNLSDPLIARIVDLKNNGISYVEMHNILKQEFPEINLPRKEISKRCWYYKQKGLLK